MYPVLEKKVLIKTITDESFYLDSQISDRSPAVKSHVKFERNSAELHNFILNSKTSNVVLLTRRKEAKWLSLELSLVFD